MGLVVGFEGLPGCGKTTVIGLLIRALEALRLRATAVDIDTSRYAPALRAIADALPIQNMARSMMYWSMRILQYDAIDRMRGGMDVIFADRTWGTALAFDGWGNGVARDALEHIGKFLRAPDITFFLRVPLAVARARKSSRTMADPDFARRVEHGYECLAARHGWIPVDAERTPEQVKEYCFEIIRARMAGKTAVVSS
jgi:thymidylate kinase